MKNTKELQPILTAIFALNETSEPRDYEMRVILDYAFRTFFGANTNLLTLACVGKKQEDILDEIHQLLDEETNFMKYIEQTTKL